MSEIFKIMLMGDVSTGKTSFMTQLIYQNAQKMPKSTVQLSFFTLRISSPPTVIQIWDSPGDQRYFFKAVTILEQFKAVIVFVDVTNEHTFHRAKLIIDQLKVYPNIIVHLILTKIDIVEKMPYKRKVSSQEVQKFAKSNGGLLFQYSQEEKVEQILENIVRHVSSNKNKKENKQKSDDRRIFNNEKRKQKSNQNSNSSKNQSCDCLIL